MDLSHADLIGELPVRLKPELEKYVEYFRGRREKLKQWEWDKAEYNLQSGLVRQQTKTLNETHELLVELYSLEPRADEELLALIKDIKYPEKEKVALLMELGIPYDNYRIWESQDGLFKANAKYVSFDEKEGVTLEKADGKQTTIELDVLRTEDQEYVRQRVHSP